VPGLFIISLSVSFSCRLLLLTRCAGTPCADPVGCRHQPRGSDGGGPLETAAAAVAVNFAAVPAAAAAAVAVAVAVAAVLDFAANRWLGRREHSGESPRGSPACGGSPCFGATMLRHRPSSSGDWPGTLKASAVAIAAGKWIAPVPG